MLDGEDVPDPRGEAGAMPRVSESLEISRLAGGVRGGAAVASFGGVPIPRALVTAPPLSGLGEGARSAASERAPATAASERPRYQGEVAGELGGAGFEGAEFDELVGGVGLVDRAGAEADGWEAGVGQVGGVREPGGADEAGAGAGGLEELQVRMIAGGFHRRVLVWVDDLDRQVGSGDRLFERGAGRRRWRRVRGGPDVDLGFGEVGDDVGAGAAADHADVEGGGPRTGWVKVARLGAEVAVEVVEGAGEFEDRVLAELGLGAVGGPAGCPEGGPEGALGGMDDVEGGGFADDGEAVVGSRAVRRNAWIPTGRTPRP